MKNITRISQTLVLIALLAPSIAYGMEQYKPRNFSWVSEEEGKKLAGLALPASKKDIEYLDNQNIGLLVTLTAEKQLPAAWFEGTNVKNIRIPVVDYTTPTFEQVDTFIKKARKMHAKGKGVAVHCWGGIGRTGTFLASWFVAEKGMDADQAIKLIRQLRPHSVETPQQEQFVRDYYKHLHPETIETTVQTTIVETINEDDSSESDS